MGIAAVVNKLQSGYLKAKDGNRCGMCKKEGCTVPPFRHRVIDGVTVTWDADSEEDRLYEMMVCIVSIHKMIVVILDEFRADDSTTESEWIRCCACASHIDGAELYKEHLKDEEHVFSEKLVSRLLTTAQDSGECTSSRTRVS